VTTVRPGGWLLVGQAWLIADPAKRWDIWCQIGTRHVGLQVQVSSPSRARGQVACVVLGRAPGPTRSRPSPQEMHMSDATNPQRQATVDHRDGGQPQTPPVAAGSPAPGHGHDDSKTVTTAAGPPVEHTDGVPGAAGDAQDDEDHAGS
jgi:hypothetical protein